MNDHFDVRAARERLELTPEALAAALQVTEGEVRGWENGSLRPPRLIRRQLEYLAARAEWDAAMRASGLPDCEWMEPRLLRLAHGTDRERVAMGREIVSHLEACETCRARNAWAREHLPPAPAPPATGLDRLFELVSRLPAWARPPAFGAITLALMTSVRLLLVLPAAFRSPMQVLQALGVVLLASGAGAVGGLAYSLTGPTLERLGWPGDYVAGIVCVAAYFGAIVAVAPLFGEPIIDDLPGLVIFAFCAVLFGILVGKFIQEGRKQRTPSG